MDRDQLEIFVKQHNLVKHEEGGYFKVTYVAEEMVNVSDRYEGDQRHASTKIDYLLDGDEFSAWHRIKSDEIWRFKQGTSLILYIFSNSAMTQNELLQVKIGDPAKEQGAVLEYTIKHDQWFAAAVNDKSSFALVECELIPGFDYRDWELGKEDVLVNSYPKYKDIITQYSRKIFANAQI